jgi:hypothetical protein
MTESDNIVQVYLTCRDVRNQVGVNRYVINNGIDHIVDVVPKLLLNNKDVIYVHLTKPIQRRDANGYLSRICQSLIDSGKVQYAEYGPLGMPILGAAFRTIFDADNNLIEDRYKIVYRRCV